MELSATTFVTLDGVYQSPGAAEEDPSNDFELGGWLPPLFDAEVGQFMDEVFDRADAFLLGRKTYQIMEPYWSNVSDPDDKAAGKLNALPKYVVTSTLQQVSWSNSVRVDGDVLGRIAELKREPGRELQIHGSGALARSLVGTGLLDTYRLLIFPVLLGRGYRLFEDVAPRTLRLVSTRRSGSGVMLQTYQVADQLSFGSVFDEQDGKNM
ncbi:dihydrofolate reductase family protein [Geodermatophilus sp. SYSU D00700]